MARTPAPQKSRPTLDSLLFQAVFADVDRATEAIGSYQEAVLWLGTPVRALGYATPISLLATEEGKDRVLAVLHRLEHGVV